MVSIAIVIGTHGTLSEQLLQTTEMILGKQNNVACVSFLTGESTKTLIKKYNTHCSKLHTKSGILFLVDMWGGSPFNSAREIVTTNKNKNYDIITGINIPILTEIFMERNENTSLQKLVNIALKTGHSSIKNVNNNNNTHEQTIKCNDNATIPTVQTNNHTKKIHMTIGLARIDDRLIHGQIVTRWTKETKIQRIIVINDEISKDTIRKTLLTQVAPPGITAHVISITKAIRVYNNPKYAQDRVMLLFTNPTDVIRLIESGIPIYSLNIGGMAYQEGKIQINNAISVDQQDIDAFKQLDKYGVKLEIRKVSSDSPLNIMDLIKKLENKHNQ